MPMHVNNSDIVTYYDQCEVDYKWLWHLNKVNAMHYGLWNEKTSKLRVALKNMNDYVISKLEVSEGDTILDAGCGVGGTSKYLAERYKVNIEGITLSQHQVNQANKSFGQGQFIGHANFSVQDFTQTNFGSEHFDSIYAIESVCHANEKADFLKECYRQLKTGGILTIAGFFMTNDVNAEEDLELMNKWADTWAVPSFEPEQSFLQKAEQAGFSISENNNITEQIKRSARRLYRMFYPGIFFHQIFKLFKIRNHVQGKNVWSTFYQYKSLKKGLWEYRVFKFTK